MPDLTSAITSALETVSSRRRGAGYARFSHSSDPDLYGTAAAIGIRATLQQPLSSSEVDDLAGAVLSFQEVDGRFLDSSHGAMHSTAIGVGALYLLGRPTTRPLFLAPLFEPGAVAPFLDGLDWTNPWLASHDAAGLLAIAVMTGVEDRPWLSEYVAWLLQNVDRSTGLWRTGAMGRIEDRPGLFGNFACSFHFHFLLRHLGVPMPFAREVVEVGLRIFEETDIVTGAREWGYPQLDWVYSLARASRESGHRTAEVDAAVRRVADLLAVEQAEMIPVAATDLHVLAAVVALIAELELGLGGESVQATRTVPPTDLRPFI